MISKFSEPRGASETVTIMLDGFWWAEGPAANRMVARSLINAWLKAFPNDRVIVATRARDAEQVSRDLPGVDIARLRIPQHGLAMMFEIGLLARRVGATHLLTHNFANIFLHHPVLVQDYLFADYPQWFTATERLYFGFMPWSSRRASVIFCSTDAEAKRVRRVLGRDRTTVKISGMGLSDELMRTAPIAPELALAPQSFLLAVGRLNVRKNLAFTLRAALLSGEIGPARPLVVVGEDHGKRETWDGEVRRAAEDGTVIFSGFVDDAELAWLYSNAKGLIFMSRGEGFGLPPVEALAFGCPVLASDIEVLREVTLGKARFVDPTDLHSASAAIAKLAKDPRCPEVSDGESIRAHYNWERVVLKIREQLTVAVDASAE